MKEIWKITAQDWIQSFKFSLILDWSELKSNRTDTGSGSDSPLPSCFETEHWESKAACRAFHVKNGFVCVWSLKNSLLFSVVFKMCPHFLLLWGCWSLWKISKFLKICMLLFPLNPKVQVQASSQVNTIWDFISRKILLGLSPSIPIQKIHFLL